jgi:hypothetical protein
MDRNAQTIVVIDKRTAELEEELRKLTGPASATANLVGWSMKRGSFLGMRERP